MLKPFNSEAEYEVKGSDFYVISYDLTGQYCKTQVTQAYLFFQSLHILREEILLLPANCASLE